MRWEMAWDMTIELSKGEGLFKLSLRNLNLITQPCSWQTSGSRNYLGNFQNKFLGPTARHSNSVCLGGPCDVCSLGEQ